MRCLIPLCGVIVSPLVLTAAGATLLGTLAGLAVGACAWAEPGGPTGRERERAEGRASEAGEPEPRRRRRGRAL
jgi:hypothetical protein